MAVLAPISRSSANPPKRHAAFGPGEARAARAHRRAACRARLILALIVMLLSSISLSLRIGHPFVSVGVVGRDRRVARQHPGVLAVAPHVDPDTSGNPTGAQEPVWRAAMAAPALAQALPTGIAWAVGGLTQVPWLAVTGPGSMPQGLPLLAPFIKWGVAAERPGVYCRFQDPAYPTHTGLDLQVDPGASVVATQAGVVAWAGENGAYGNLVVVESAGYQTWYAHLSRIDVSARQVVSAGAQLGLSGGRSGAPGAGSSGGPHLHYAVRWLDEPQGRALWLDPAAFLPDEATAYLGCSR